MIWALRLPRGMCARRRGRDARRRGGLEERRGTDARLRGLQGTSRQPADRVLKGDHPERKRCAVYKQQLAHLYSVDATRKSEIACARDLGTRQYLRSPSRCSRRHARRPASPSGGTRFDIANLFSPRLGRIVFTALGTNTRRQRMGILGCADGLPVIFNFS